MITKPEEYIIIRSREGTKITASFMIKTVGPFMCRGFMYVVLLQMERLIILRQKTALAWSVGMTSSILLDKLCTFYS